MRLRIASGPIRWYMQACGFKGWASFWETIYVLPGWEFNRPLIRHELCHLEQIKADGRLLFSMLYLYWLWRFGYSGNPYEIEARAAETLWRTPL